MKYLYQRNNGIITKYKEIQDKVYMDIETGITLNKDEVLLLGKVEENIIELVEVGDYINGELVYRIYNKYQRYENSNYKFIEKTIETDNDNYETIPFANLYINSDIKSIVTKEQFEKVKFEV